MLRSDIENLASAAQTNVLSSDASVNGKVLLACLNVVRIAYIAHTRQVCCLDLDVVQEVSCLRHCVAAERDSRVAGDSNSVSSACGEFKHDL
jgi:hypothetical protein